MCDHCHRPATLELCSNTLLNKVRRKYAWRMRVLAIGLLAACSGSAATVIDGNQAGDGGVTVDGATATDAAPAEPPAFRLVAQRMVNGKQRLWQYATNTSSWTEIVGTNAWGAPVYSADGNSVIASTGQGIGRIAITGGTATYVGLPIDTPRALTPNGLEVVTSAYGRPDANGNPKYPFLLYRVNVATGTATSLTSQMNGVSTRDDDGGAYLADGNLLFSRRLGNFSTYVIAKLDAGGTVTPWLTPPANFVYTYPAINNTKTKVAFLRCAGTGSAYDQSTCDVMTANTDGSGLVNVTNDPRRRHWPAFVPDGSHVVVAEGETLGTAKLTLVRLSDGQVTDFATPFNVGLSPNDAATSQGQITVAIHSL